MFNPADILHGGLIRQFGFKLALGWAGDDLRAASEGKQWPAVKVVLDWLRGKKTYLGALLGGTAAVLLAFGRPEQVQLLSTLVAGLGLVTLGLADKAWRSSPFTDQDAWWRILRDHWADVVTLAGIVTASLSKCDPSTAALLAHAHLSCKAGIGIVTAFLAFGGWLIGEAKLATPPATA